MDVVLELDNAVLAKRRGRTWMPRFAEVRSEQLMVFSPAPTNFFESTGIYRLAPRYIFTNYETEGYLSFQLLRAIALTPGPFGTVVIADAMRDDTGILEPNGDLSQTDFYLNMLEEQTVYHENWPTEIQLQVTPEQIIYRPIHRFELTGSGRLESLGNGYVFGFLVAPNRPSTLRGIVLFYYDSGGNAEQFYLTESNYYEWGGIVDPGQPSTIETDGVFFDDDRTGYRFLVGNRLVSTVLKLHDQTPEDYFIFDIPRFLGHSTSTDPSLTIRDGERPTNPDFETPESLDYTEEETFDWEEQTYPGTFAGMSMANLLAAMPPRSGFNFISNWSLITTYMGELGGEPHPAIANQLYHATVTTLNEWFPSLPLIRYSVFKSVHVFFNPDTGKYRRELKTTRVYKIDVGYHETIGPELASIDELPQHLELIAEEGDPWPDHWAHLDPYLVAIEDESTPDYYVDRNWVEEELLFAATETDSITLIQGQDSVAVFGPLHFDGAEEPHGVMYTEFYKNPIPGMYLEQVPYGEPASQRPYCLTGNPTEPGTYEITVYGSIGTRQGVHGDTGNPYRPWKSNLTVTVIEGTCPSPTNYAALEASIAWTNPDFYPGNATTWNGGWDFAAVVITTNVTNIVVTGHPPGSTVSVGDVLPGTPGVSIDKGDVATDGSANGSYNVRIRGEVASGTHAGCPIDFFLTIHVNFS